MIEVSAEPRGETLDGEGFFVGRKCLPMSSTFTSSNRHYYSYIIGFFEPFLGIDWYSCSEFLSTAWSIISWEENKPAPVALRLNLLAEKPKLAPPSYLCFCVEERLSAWLLILDVWLLAVSLFIQLLLPGRRLDILIFPAPISPPSKAEPL